MNIFEQYIQGTLALENMELEQLQDLQQIALEKHAELMMQIESLEMAGGTSRTYAQHYLEHLPSEIVLESFTSQVTNTNYRVSMESLSNVAKVAMVVGLIAIVGTIALLIYRMAGKNDPTPQKNKAEGLRHSLSELEQAKQEVDAALGTSEPLPFESLLLQELSEGGATNALLMILQNQNVTYAFYCTRLTSVMESIDAYLKRVFKIFIPMAERLGPNATVGEFNAHSRLELYEYDLVQALKGTVGNWLDDFKQAGFKGAPLDKAEHDVIVRVVKHIKGPPNPYPDNVFSSVEQTRKIIRDMEPRITRGSKELENNGKKRISREVSIALRDCFESAETALREVESSFKYIDFEIDEYNRAVNLYGRVVGKCFKEVSERVTNSHLDQDEKRRLVKALKERYERLKK